MYDHCTEVWGGVTRSFRDRDPERIAFFFLAGAMFAIAFSIALGQTLAGLCFAATVVGLAARRVRVRWPVEAWFAVAFAVVALGTVLAGVDPHSLWKKTGKLCWFLLIPVTAMLVRNSGQARALVVAFVTGCVVKGLETTVRNPFLAWRRPIPNFLTALIDRGSMADGQVLMLGLVITLVMVLLAWREQRRLPGWLVVALVVQAVGLLLNFKRGSWICAIALAGGVVLAHARWRTWLVLLGVLAVLASLPPVQVRFAQLRGEFDDRSGGRMAMWTRITPALIKAYPHGIGYGALTNDLMRKVYSRVERNRNHMHANWAQVLVETGWVGLALYTVWMAWLAGAAVRGVWSARLGPSPAYAAATAVLLVVAGLLLNGVVEYNFGNSELMMVLAMFAGLLAALRRIAGVTPIPAEPGPPSAVAS